MTFTSWAELLSLYLVFAWPRGKQSIFQVPRGRELGIGWILKVEIFPQEASSMVVTNTVGRPMAVIFQHSKKQSTPADFQYIIKIPIIGLRNRLLLTPGLYAGLLVGLLFGLLVGLLIGLSTQMTTSP